jgi:hypothetical protein
MISRWVDIFSILKSRVLYQLNRYFFIYIFHFDSDRTKRQHYKFIDCTPDGSTTLRHGHNTCWTPEENPPSSSTARHCNLIENFYTNWLLMYRTKLMDLTLTKIFLSLVYSFSLFSPFFSANKEYWNGKLFSDTNFNVCINLMSDPLTLKNNVLLSIL